MDWIETLSKREAGVIEALGTFLRTGNQGYEAIPPGLRNEFFYKDMNANIVHPNLLWKEWGYDSSDMMEDLWLEKIHHEDRESLHKAYIKYASNPEMGLSQSIFRICDAAGRYHWVLSSSTALKRFQSGDLDRFIGRDVDIGSRIEKEEALRRHTELVEDRAARDRALVEAAGQIAGVTDEDALLSAVNKAALEILKLENFRLVAVKNNSACALLGPDLPSCLTGDRFYQASREARGQAFSLQSENNSNSTFISWPLGDLNDSFGLAVFEPREGSNIDTDHLMGFLAPLVYRAWQQVEILRTLKQDATTDPLTGAWNRRAFLHPASNNIREGIRKNLSSSVVILDIDHFKHINDEHGHSFGDKVLKYVTQGLQETLRGGDMLCRWGGEEFTIFLEQTGRSRILHIAERIRAAASNRCRSLAVNIILSAGCRTIQAENPESLETAISIADEALLKAKRSGRNRVIIAD